MYNPKLAAVAEENINRILKKSAFVPAGPGGTLNSGMGPPSPGGPPPMMPPGGPPPGMGPEMPPMGGPEGELPPQALAALMGGAPEGAPPEGQATEAKLEAISAKLDQLIGIISGFLMGQQTGGGNKKPSGGGGNDNELLKQIAAALGIQPKDNSQENQSSQQIPGVPVGMPGSAMPALGNTPGLGMMVSASVKDAINTLKK